jgi:hypothetical protein
MKQVRDIIFNNPAQCVTLPVYDKTKVVLGTMIQQKTGVNPDDNFVGPWPTAIARPGEAATAIPSTYPHAVEWNENIIYVAMADLATAAATRRIVLYEYNKQTQQFTWRGFITLTFPTATAHTIRGLRAVDYRYSTGKVAVSGTTVTGTGTGFVTTRQAVGARIGFGTTDATKVTTWYDITAISSDTSLTIAQTAESGTNLDYVIQETRLAVATTNATTTNGGLYIVKGLHWGMWSQTGLIVPMATTVDNIRAVYWLKETAGTSTITTVTGVAIDDTWSWTQHDAYVPNSGTTTFHIFKFNMRAALTNLVSGASELGWTCRTANTTLVGTISQTNNGRVATIQHSAAAGIKSLWFVTTSRVYRVPLSDITEGSNSYLADSMVENPKGSTIAITGTSAMTSAEYSPSLDRFIITGGTTGKSYVTQYRTDSGQFDLNFLGEHRMNNPLAAESGIPLFPSLTGISYAVWAEGGVLFMVRNTATTTQNQLYAVCIGAESTFKSDQVVITPAIPIANASKLYRVMVAEPVYAGDPAYAVTYEGFRIFYRTSGITDNSGPWTPVGSAGDLSGVLGSEIQFKVDFRVLGTTCLPARIHALSLIYEDNTTDSNYEPSVGNSNLAARVFAWRQVTLFSGGKIPNLRVRLYDVTNPAVPVLLTTDFSDTPSNGIWEYSANEGQTWQPWNANANTIGNYIRFKPTILPTSKRLRALLTQ